MSWTIFYGVGNTSAATQAASQIPKAALHAAEKIQLKKQNQSTVVEADLIIFYLKQVLLQ